MDHSIHLNMGKYYLIQLLKKKQPRLVRLIQLSKPRSAVEVIQSINDNTKKRQEAIYTYLANENIDVWVMPGFPLPAFRHGTAGVLLFKIDRNSTIC